MLTQCTLEDVQQLARIRREIEESLAAEGIEQWPVGSMGAEQIEQLIRDGEWWAIRDGDDIAVAVRLLDSDPLLWPDNRKALYLHSLMVNPEYGGRGLARDLFEILIDVARERGLKQIRLDCVPRLLPFYEKLGFIRTGFWHTWNTSETEVSYLLYRPVPEEPGSTRNVLGLTISRKLSDTPAPAPSGKPFPDSPFSYALMDADIQVPAGETCELED